MIIARILPVWRKKKKKKLRISIYDFNKHGKEYSNNKQNKTKI